MTMATKPRKRTGPGRPCTICEHADRDQIDDDLRCGIRYRTIARRYGIASHANVLRHAEAHVERISVPGGVEDATDPERIKRTLLELEERLKRIADELEGTDARTAIAALREFRMTVELLARIGGQLDMQITVLLEAEVERFAGMFLGLWVAVRAAVEEGLPLDVIERERLPLMIASVIDTTAVEEG